VIMFDSEPFETSNAVTRQGAASALAVRPGHPITGGPILLDLPLPRSAGAKLGHAKISARQRR
jgi:hypothetical protein